MRDDDELLRLYLLGELETEEEDRLEARLIQDHELFERAEAVEADLLEEYAHGVLSTSQRSRLQRHLATSAASRSQLAMVRTLGKAADEKLAPVLTGPWWKKELSSPWFRTLAAAMLAIAVLAGWFDYRTTRLQNQIEVMASQVMPPIPGQRGDELPPPPPPTPVIDHDAERIAEVKPTPEPVVVQLLQLAVAALRGPEEVEVLSIEPETDRVDFQLSLLPGDDAYPAYQIVIRNSATGEELIRRDDLRSRKTGSETVLLLSMNAKEIPAGAYEATVKGLPSRGDPEDLGFPQFQVAEPEMNPQG